MIDGVQTKLMRVMPDERGFLMEILRSDDPLFKNFGQLYLTAAYPGVVKGWHYHERQTDFFVCIQGMMKLVLYDNREDSPTKGQVNQLFLGELNRQLVVIPPGIWHGFKCISDEIALVVNAPDKVYDYLDPDEIRCDPHINDIPYEWDRKDG